MKNEVIEPNRITAASLSGNELLVMQQFMLRDEDQIALHDFLRVHTIRLGQFPAGSIEKYLKMVV